MKISSCSAVQRARRGFTLVEILVVIAIIALLAGIAFPVFSRARESGRRAVCSNNLKQLGLAFAQYTQDSGGRYPGSGNAYTPPEAGACFASTCNGWVKGKTHWVSGPKNEFLASPSSPFAATGKQAQPEDGSLFPYVKSTSVYRCPSNADGEKKRLSYSMNCALTLAGPARITAPSDIVLLVDEEYANDGFFYAIGKPSLAGNTTSGGEDNPPDSTDMLTARHNGGGNLLFADGHVKWYSNQNFPLDGSDKGKANKWKTAGVPRFHDRALGVRGSYAPPYAPDRYVTDFCNASIAPGAGGPGNDDGTANIGAPTPGTF